MKKPVLFSAAALIAMLTVSSVVVWAEDEAKEKEEDEDKPVAVDKLPVNVLQAAQAAVPGATAESASTEEEDGAKIYEVAFKGTDGKKIEASVTADGNLIETEQEAKEADLPAAVKQTLKEVLPGGKGLEAEKKLVVIYEVKKEVGEKTYELTIDATGKVLSIVAENEEDDD